MKRLLLALMLAGAASVAAAQSEYVQQVPINHGLKAPQGEAIVSAYDLYGKRLLRSIFPLAEVAADALTPVCESSPSDVYLVRLELTDSRGGLLSRNDYVKRCPENSYAGVVVKEKSKQAGCALLQVSNPGKTVAVGFRPVLRDEAGNPILPAYYSDSCLNLLPGEKRTIEVRY